MYIYVYYNTDVVNSLSLSTLVLLLLLPLLSFYFYVFCYFHTKESPRSNDDRVHLNLGRNYGFAIVPFPPPSFTILTKEAGW